MLALGDRMAQGLGVSLLKTRLLALLAIALLCGAAVSIAGPIGFIGLVVPQLIRRLVSVDLRVMVPLSALCGRWFCCWRISLPARCLRPGSWQPAS
jgi:iron complex transport system permease protein